MSLETLRLAREKEFHNQRFEDDAARSQKTNRFYAATIDAYEFFEDNLMTSRGEKALEYGCGAGGYAFGLQENFPAMHGIDISEVAVTKAQFQAEKIGCTERTNFLVMNAEKLEFDDSTFDLVCGSGIIHHLNVEKAMFEIRRVLKPGGHALFIEPLGHNFFINLFRKLTPNLRSEDEHPLLEKDLKLIQEFFPKSEFTYFGFASLASALLIGTPLFSFLRKVGAGIDRLLFKLPFFRRQAWIVVLNLRD